MIFDLLADGAARIKGECFEEGYCLFSKITPQYVGESALLTWSV